jgi:hypothetical protein
MEAEEKTRENDQKHRGDVACNAWGRSKPRWKAENMKIEKTQKMLKNIISLEHGTW